MNLKCRLGGSSLAHVFGEIGKETCDLDEGKHFINCFYAIQELLSSNNNNKPLLKAGHDVSDGGLFVCALEMAFAGNTSVKLSFDFDFELNLQQQSNVLFGEELGYLFQISKDGWSSVKSVFEKWNVASSVVVVGEVFKNKNKQQSVDVYFSEKGDKKRYAN